MGKFHPYPQNFVHLVSFILLLLHNQFLLQGALDQVFPMKGTGGAIPLYSTVRGGTLCISPILAPKTLSKLVFHVLIDLFNYQCLCHSDNPLVRRASRGRSITTASPMLCMDEAFLSKMAPIDAK